MLLTSVTSPNTSLNKTSSATSKAEAGKHLANTNADAKQTAAAEQNLSAFNTVNQQRVEAKADEQPSAKQQEAQQLEAEKKAQLNLPLEAVGAKQERTSAPDFTLNLSSSTEKTLPVPEPKLRPDEIKYGRRRPNLPISFSFGMPRGKSVAVAMRNPLLGAQAPSTRAQAVQDTFDLAATNRVTYEKGSGLHLIA